MSGSFLLDTATLAVSLFNAMLLLWLGIVVLSSADRRSWGIWLAGGGLLCGGIFFLIHTALVGRGLHDATAALDGLWHLGWMAIIAAPLAWYVVILWYAGVLGLHTPQNEHLRRIHLPGLAFTLVSAAVLLILLLVVGSLPAFAEIVNFGRANSAPTPGTPLLVVVYAVYNVACIALSIHALRHPAPSARWMGDLARRRARPWLTAAALVLLGVSFLVSAFVVVLYFGYGPRLAARQAAARELLGEFDVLVGALIGVAVVLIGKATVSYEIFTGKTLPRRGFLRQWRRAVILAAGYSALIAAALGLSYSALDVLLLATVLLVLFYALLSARLFDERERVVRELRPFLVAQGKNEELWEGGGRAPFDALCENVLNTRVAYLLPLIPFGAALAVPPDAALPKKELPTLAVQFSSPAVVCIAVPPERYGGAAWAVPLWRERGLAGVLLLGERSDGGLYAQEEIEIAQATGERILEAEARAELTRRLIELQRGRLTATQIADRRARRLLHDDILPQLHTAMLNLSAGDADGSLAQFKEVHHALSNLLRELPSGASPQLEREGVLGALRQTLDLEFRGEFEAVQWNVSPEAAAHARALSALNAEVVFAAAREAIRNAAKHGRGGDSARPLHLCVRAACEDGLWIEIQDDGVGLGGNGNGSGQGLQLHSTMMAIIGGALAFTQTRNETRVRLSLPATAMA